MVCAARFNIVNILEGVVESWPGLHSEVVKGGVRANRFVFVRQRGTVLKAMILKGWPLEKRVCTALKEC